MNWLCHYGRWKVPRSAVTKLKTQETDGLVPVQRLAGSRPLKSCYFGLSPKDEKTAMSKFKGRKAWGILSYSRLVFLFVSFRLSTYWWSPPTSWSGIRFTQTTESTVHFIQEHPTDTLGFMFDQICGHYFQLGWRIKLTTIVHLFDLTPFFISK